MKNGAFIYKIKKNSLKINNLEILNSILRVLENGSKWCSLGKKWHTIYTREHRWSRNMALLKVNRLYKHIAR